MGGVALLYPRPEIAQSLQFRNEFFNLARAIAEQTFATRTAAQPNYRQSRILPRRMVAHPIDRNAQPLRYLLWGEQIARVNFPFHPIHLAFGHSLFVKTEMAKAENGLKEKGNGLKGKESALWVLFVPLRRPPGRRSGLCVCCCIGFAIVYISCRRSSRKRG